MVGSKGADGLETEAGRFGGFSEEVNLIWLHAVWLCWSKVWLWSWEEHLPETMLIVSFPECWYFCNRFKTLVAEDGSYLSIAIM